MFRTGLLQRKLKHSTDEEDHGSEQKIQSVRPTTDLHQQGHRSGLVDLQNFSVFGSHQDVTVTQSDGSDGRVVLQQQACTHTHTHTQV